MLNRNKKSINNIFLRLLVDSEVDKIICEEASLCCQKIFALRLSKSFLWISTKVVSTSSTKVVKEGNVMERKQTRLKWMCRTKNCFWLQYCGILNILYFIIINNNINNNKQIGTFLFCAFLLVVDIHCYFLKVHANFLFVLSWSICQWVCNLYCHLTLTSESHRSF